MVCGLMVFLPRWRFCCTSVAPLAHLVTETSLRSLVSVVSHSLLLCLLENGNSPRKGHRMLTWLCLLAEREQSPESSPTLQPIAQRNVSSSLPRYRSSWAC